MKLKGINKRSRGLDKVPIDWDKSSTIPIVAMTANAFSEDVSKSLNAGMNDHISKPIDLKKLHAVLGKYAGRKDNEDK